MPHFDAYLFADWSASSLPTSPEPRPDAIWVGWLRPERTEPESAYFRTRHDAIDFLEETLLGWVVADQRVLVGFDFPYGYPVGTAEALGRDGWRGIWNELADAIDDGPKNENNRWTVAAALNHRIEPDTPGPFWGCPPSGRASTLTSKQKGIVDFPYNGALAQRRLTELCLPRTQETWKLLGAGSVGSQALLGIPRVHHLRFHPELTPHSLVWPFETGFAIPVDRRPLILHAEVWPGIVEERVRAHQTGTIRDRVQVEQLCLWASEENRAGRLDDVFGRPTNLTDDQVELILREEGWILGAD
ncbi:MAG: hypothetical protein AAGD38_02485 [Acidobacteriota bacterium]